MDTITLSKAKSELRIGRDRLVKLLKDCQIEVIQVNAQRKEITFKQLEHLRSIIASGSEATPYQNPTQIDQYNWLTCPKIQQLAKKATSNKSDWQW